jgi:DNA/RNA-binding domain of Phe-tRNA-synthetase-like protein
MIQASGEIPSDHWPASGHERHVVHMIDVGIVPHPRLLASGFVTVFDRPLDEMPPSAATTALLDPHAEAPLVRDEAVRAAIRDMLRYCGYKPTGRGKPASEYLVRLAEEGLPRINAAVDACNAVSLHSGLPISIIDMDRARAPFRIAPGRAGDSYVFNASGQEIDLDGLLCLWDADGPCGNAVKDAQRTKTGAATRRTLSIVWGCSAHGGRLDDTVRWYRSLLEDLGAATEPIDFRAET